MASHTLSTCWMGVGPAGAGAEGTTVPLDAEEPGVAGALSVGSGLGAPSEEEAAGEEAAGATAAFAPAPAREQLSVCSKTAPSRKERRLYVDQQRVCLIDHYPSHF
jgi:hypothetical protein